MKNLITLSLCLLLICTLGCKKKATTTTACGVENPLQNLAWLNDKYALFTGGAELNSIVSYSYQGKEIIEIKQSVSSMYNGHIYNCDGTQITFDQATYIDFSKNRTRLAIIYGTWMLN